MAQSSRDIVEAVKIEGNQRIEADTVRSYMLIGRGDPFDPGRIDRSLKSLYSSGLFADVSIRRVGNGLTVSVVENPVINRLVFEGNRKIDDETLAAEVQLRPRVVYTRSRVQSDARRIVQVYQRSGRFAATVEPKVIQQPSNRV
ncbi:MAG: outer membrane protein assembly factor BamA, partial [Alphaproteobacteria bacterium]|nr:outer membrane protein assembly factor BamA [Alphaproteobacteria bacterium]